MQKTLGWLLLPGSESPFAPSPNHFWGFSLFWQSRRSFQGLAAGNSSIWEGAGNRRKHRRFSQKTPQIFAENHRFSQRTAGNRRLGSVTLGASPLARPYIFNASSTSPTEDRLSKSLLKDPHSPQTIFSQNSDSLVSLVAACGCPAPLRYCVISPCFRKIRKRAEYCFESTVSDPNPAQNCWLKKVEIKWNSGGINLLKLRWHIFANKFRNNFCWDDIVLTRTVLFRTRELTEPHWVLGQTLWVLQQTRWVRIYTQIIGWEELTEFAPRNSVSPEKLTEFGVWNRTPLLPYSARFRKSNGGFSEGGFSNNRFVLRPNVAIASEVLILSKNSLAITDFHAKRKRGRFNYLKTPFLEPPHSRSPIVLAGKWENSRRVLCGCPKFLAEIENALACYRDPGWSKQEFPREMPNKKKEVRNSGLPEFSNSSEKSSRP